MPEKKKIIDFHAHILPGADHGSHNVKESREQLRMLFEAGVDEVVATPHFYPHKENFDEFEQRRRRAFDECKRICEKERMPEIRLGAEAFVCRGMERMPEVSQLCVEGTRTLLLEMPMGEWPAELLATVTELQESNGLTVVLAHVERYDPVQVQCLFDYGLTGQINISALNRLFVKRAIKKWIHEGKIVALGSDLHGTGRKPPEFARAEKYLKEYFDDIMRNTEQLLRVENRIQ